MHENQCTTCEEIWKDVPGYEGFYAASNMGRIKRLCAGPGAREGRYLGFGDGHGYLVVHLSVNGRKQRSWIHSLVLLAFVGPYPDGMEIRHLDGNPLNNRLSNLVYGTHQENIQDTLAHGKTTQGERNPQAKLDYQKVAAIRRMHADGYSLGAIGERFGVTGSNIHCVVKGKTWLKNTG